MSLGLCFDLAEWIVQHCYLNGPVPFADFGTITFADTTAIANGITVGASSGFEADMIP
jgi:hypothetical protein